MAEKSSGPKSILNIFIVRYLRSTLVATLILLVLADALGSVAYADSPAPPHDYTEVTESEQYVFVMLARDEMSAYNQVGRVVKDEAIRSKYTQSGLYENNGSTTPLWTIDWYSFTVAVSSNGRHLVRFGPWARSGNYVELALAFYEDGREIQSYRVDQLVTIPFLLPASVSHYQWLEDASFDDARSRLSVQTKSWDSYVFDVKTGNVVEGFQLPFLPKCLILLSAIAAIWLGVRFLVRKQRPPQVAKLE